MDNLFNRMFADETNNNENFEEIISMSELEELNRKYFNNELDTDPQPILSEIVVPKVLPRLTRQQASTQKVSTQKPLGRESWYNFIRIPSFLRKATDVKNPLVESIDIISTLKGYLSDPLGMMTIVFSSFILFLYFASEFICQIVGLFYPAYYLYTIMHYKIPNKLEKLSLLLKYFIIYAHLELVSSLLKIFGLYLYHLKILITIAILYLFGYQTNALVEIYGQILFYDKILFKLMNSGINRILTEYAVIKKEMEKHKEEK